jgi:hypothetical protein
MKIKTKVIFYPLVLIFLIIVFPQTQAIIPSNVMICDASIDCTQNVKVALISHVSTNYLTFQEGSQGGFFNQAIISGKTNFAFINFTALTLTSNTNPNQNFSVSVLHTNASIYSVTKNNLGFIESFTGTVPKLYYYWDNDVTYSSPTSVNVSGLSSTQYIPSSQYQSSLANFVSCIAPCVYSDSSNNTLMIKSQTISPVKVNICVIGICPSITPNSNNIIVAGYSIDDDVSIPYIFLFFIIVVLILILAFSRREY